MKKREPVALFFFKIAQFLKFTKKETISLTGLDLSFSDLGCFILEFDILKSTMSYMDYNVSRHKSCLIKHTRLSCFHMFKTLV